MEVRRSPSIPSLYMVSVTMITARPVSHNNGLCSCHRSAWILRKGALGEMVSMFFQATKDGTRS